MFQSVTSDNEKAMMSTTIATSFIAFLYHGGEKNSKYKLNEPSQKAVKLVVLHLCE